MRGELIGLVVSALPAECASQERYEEVLRSYVGSRVRARVQLERPTGEVRSEPDRRGLTDFSAKHRLHFGVCQGKPRTPPSPSGSC
jgi:hypothetical protein